MKYVLLRNAKIAWLLLCSSLCLSIGVCAQSPDTANSKVVNREFSLALVTGYLKQKKFDEAETYLKEHLIEDSSDHKAWNTLGLVYIEKNRINDAEAAFSKAASLASGNDKAVYLYNAADAANRAGHLDQSQIALNEAIQSAIPISGIGDQIERNRNVIKVGEPLPVLNLDGSGQSSQTKGLTALVTLKSGYDSNVTLLPDAADRNPQPGSALLSPIAALNYGAPLGNGIFDAKSITSFTDYLNSNASQYTNLFESVTAEWSPKAFLNGKLTTTFGDRFDFSFANTNGLQFYNWIDSLDADAAYRLDSVSLISAQLPVGYQRFPGVLLDGPDDNRDGWLVTPTIIYQRKLGNFTLSAGGTFQHVWALGVNYQSNAYGVLLGVATSLVWNVNARFGTGYQYIDYFNSTQGRQDRNLNASLNLSKVMPFEKRLTAAIDYLYVNNNSNLNTASYSQHVITLQVSYAIK